MREVIDQLRESNQPIPVPLDLPDDEDILEVEEEILLPIRGDFREFLLTVSDVVYGSLEPVTVADPSSHTHLSEVTSVAWSEGLPRDQMVVCASPEGYYVIDQEGTVRIWSGGSYIDGEWNSIWNWVKEVWLES